MFKDNERYEYVDGSCTSIYIYITLIQAIKNPQANIIGFAAIWMFNIFFMSSQKSCELQELSSIICSFQTLIYDLILLKVNSDSQSVITFNQIHY